MPYNVNELYNAFCKVVENDNYTYHSMRANNKLGYILAANVLPLVTCHAACMGTCGASGCYAIKNALCHGYNLNKNACLKAWAENTAMLIYKPAEYYSNIRKDITSFYNKCKKNNLPCYVRIHSSGDFYSLSNLQEWIKISNEFQDVHFLAFTKQFEILMRNKNTIPENLEIVLSDWDGIKIPQKLTKKFKIAYVEKGKNCFMCLGNCSKCRECWHLTKNKHNVRFKKH